ncbi:hypothetical protein IP92_04461 [Pseudoduganella flava]|uniref:Class I SAM-dependent methyltransferase n=1 Tax=Pseudoduganella flava TaxID=871742 RepID=A0A562PJ75_9BURK|nr:class I SAM-dependent methyltransferase [Pseudoduganella flava]QGZ42081.1 class I SAM-dependent methyltransferase [Pseudoduganella flava]TWI44511.1 hypothetical protein IP92_04461 [Pseudoduganella flava]
MKLVSNFQKRLTDYSRTDSIGSRFRTKRAAALVRLIEEEAARSGQVRIIDLGGERNYWNIIPADFLRRHRVHITLVNKAKHATPPDDELFAFIDGDACNLASLDSMSFGIVHSNSVIEHVGDWQRMVAFAGEVRRLAPHYFVQTPHFWFPLEPHFMAPFFHWLPETVRASLLMRFELGTWPRATSASEAMAWVQTARLLDRKLFTALFCDANVTTERLLGLPKSLIAVK